MNKWQSDFDKSFKRTQRFVTWFIGGVLVMILLSWIGMAVLAYKGAEMASEEGGIKPMIEKLWCGKPGCLDAERKVDRPERGQRTNR